jgi:hypothetical protein
MVLCSHPAATKISHHVLGFTDNDINLLKLHVASLEQSKTAINIETANDLHQILRSMDRIDSLLLSIEKLTQLSN